jgi:NarL family two-component system response regulator LiaR
LPPEVRVLVVDDHPVVRQGLREFLATQADLEVVGEAADGNEAVAAAAQLRPDVVLLDLLMPELDGVAAIAPILAASPGSRIIVLTSVPGDEQVLPALQEGAAGYLLKDAAPAELAAAVRTVAAGGAALAGPAARRVVDAATRLDSTAAPESARQAGLTPREMDVLRLVARGLANKAIARALIVSEKTVKTHMSSILAKLRARDRTQAALWAVRHGFGEE